MFRAERVRGLKHLNLLCNGIGRDFEFRGKVRSKWVVRLDPKTGKYFVYKRGTQNSLGNHKAASLRAILPGLYSGKLWTCEPLRAEQILKWPWQIKLAAELQRKRIDEHKVTHPTSGRRMASEPQPAGN